MLRIRNFIYIILLTLPTTVLATVDDGWGNLPIKNGSPDLGSVIYIARSIMNLLVPLCVVLALIYFIYGMANYILESNNEAKKIEGKARMIWGSIALFVIISVWGLVTFIQVTFNIDTTTEVYSPKPW